MRRQIIRSHSLLECLPRRLRRLLRRRPPMRDRRRLRRQPLLRLVHRRPGKRLLHRNLLQRHIREQPHEPPDIRILSVPPELPVIVRRKPVRPQPNRPLGAFSHLRARRRRNQRCRQPKHLPLLRPPHQLHARHDIAPLVRPAHLQRHPLPAIQLAKIETLQNHVVELKERQRLLPVQPQPHAVERQHPVDREMRPHIPQQLDPPELIQPIRIVQHDRIRGPGAKPDELPRTRPDARHVRRDPRIVQHLPALVLPRRIPDPRRPPAHQHHRPMPMPLHQPQQHQLHQVPDVQTIRRAIEPDIAADGARVHQRPQRLRIGALEHETARRGLRQKRCFGHPRPLARAHRRLKPRRRAQLMRGSGRGARSRRSCAAPRLPVRKGGSRPGSSRWRLWRPPSDSSTVDRSRHDAACPGDR